MHEKPPKPHYMVWRFGRVVEKKGGQNKSKLQETIVNIVLSGCWWFGCFLITDAIYLSYLFMTSIYRFFCSPRFGLHHSTIVILQIISAPIHNFKDPLLFCKLFLHQSATSKLLPFFYPDLFCTTLPIKTKPLFSNLFSIPRMVM